MSLYSIILILHIISGFLALGFGLVAISAPKGKKWHKNAGFIYTYSMIVVSMSSTMMYFIKGNRLLFLLLIGLFSLYQVINGLHYLKLVKQKNKLGTRTHIIRISSSICALMMLIFGILDLLQGPAFRASLLLSFGSIMLMMVLGDFRYDRQARLDKIKYNHGLRKHIVMMGGAYIATFTAFTVTNLHFLPGYIGWFLPTLIGSLIIFYNLRKVKVSKDASSSAKPLGDFLITAKTRK